jgi:hypothetical protein
MTPPSSTLQQGSQTLFSLRCNEGHYANYSKTSGVATKYHLMGVFETFRHTVSHILINIISFIAEFLHKNCIK